MKNRHDVPWNSPLRPAIAREALIFIHPVSNAAIETTASSELADGRGLLSLYDMFRYMSLLEIAIKYALFTLFLCRVAVYLHHLDDIV